jgi:transposase
MSTKEISRLEVMQRLSRKQMSQKEASRILRRSTRQIKRMLQAYRQQGAAGLVSKHEAMRLEFVADQIQRLWSDVGA